MKYLFRCFVLILIIGGVLMGCGTDRQEPGPEDGAKEWIDAIVNQDGNRILKYTCKEHRDDVKEAGMWISAFAVLGQLLTNRSVQIEGDISDLKLETVSESDDQAEIRVYGELRVAVLANASAYDVDERWIMIKEDDTWRWCNPNPSTFSLGATDTPTVEIAQVTPAHTLFPPTPIPDIQITKSTEKEPSLQKTDEPVLQLAEQIIGKWQFRMDQGGIEYHFLEDHSVELNLLDAQGQVLPACKGVYTLNGPELTYEITEGAEETCPKGTKRVVKVEILGGDVLLHIDEYETLPLTRVHPGQETVETIEQLSEKLKQNIIGTWQIKFPYGTIEYQFFNNGKLEWRAIDAQEGRLMFTVKGNYTLNSQMMVVMMVVEFTEIPDEVTAEFTFEKDQVFMVVLSGDSLYLLGPSNEWMKGVRVSAN